jgi:dTDP-4-amino-4,6-dideoxygalactose transaminase
LGQETVEIPRQTYVSVPCAIKRRLSRCDGVTSNGWGLSAKAIRSVWDCARRFTSGMYVAGQYQCISFATAKILGAEQGGAILHDDDSADSWFRKMRFDGRTEGVDPREDTFDVVGHHFLGDRFEILAAATAAHLARVPILHIGGGDM